MRDLELLGEYLQRLRQEKLKTAHQMALGDDPRAIHIAAQAHQAELCTRIQEALKVLAHDSGKFIKEFLQP